VYTLYTTSTSGCFLRIFLCSPFLTSRILFLTTRADGPFPIDCRLLCPRRVTDDFLCPSCGMGTAFSSDFFRRQTPAISQTLIFLRPDPPPLYAQGALPLVPDTPFPRISFLNPELLRSCAFLCFCEGPVFLPRFMFSPAIFYSGFPPTPSLAATISQVILNHSLSPPTKVQGTLRICLSSLLCRGSPR